MVDESIAYVMERHTNGIMSHCFRSISLTDTTYSGNALKYA